MRQIKLKPYLTNEELNKILNNQKDIKSFKDWQIIHAVQINPGKEAEEISSILGVTKRKVYDVIERYNRIGKNWKAVRKWGGRRKSNAYMTIEEEKELFLEITERALSGKIITYHDIKEEIKKRIKNEFSDDYVWVLFKRHGWSKKAPRSKHPLSNTEEQEEFKKTSLKSWQP